MPWYTFDVRKYLEETNNTMVFPLRYFLKGKPTLNVVHLDSSREMVF